MIRVASKRIGPRGSSRIDDLRDAGRGIRAGFGRG